MNVEMTQITPCRSILWGAEKPTLLRNSVLIILGSMLVALSAKFTVPLQPVPITLQSLAVLFVSMTMGWRLGGCAILLYLLEGLSGLPVFSVGFLAPQMGYLIGFFLAALIGGYLAEHGWCKHFITTIVAAGLATSVILSSGYFVLAHFVGYTSAFILGVKPFLFGDSLKVIFLACVVPVFWQKRLN